MHRARVRTNHNHFFTTVFSIRLLIDGPKVPLYQFFHKIFIVNAVLTVIDVGIMIYKMFIIIIITITIIIIMINNFSRFLLGAFFCFGLLLCVKR